MSNLPPHIKTLLASVVGSVVGILAAFDRLTVRQKLSAIACGAGMAFGTAEFIASFFDSPGALGMVSFTTGLCGMAICRKLLLTIDNVDVVAIIRSRFGG